MVVVRLLGGRQAWEEPFDRLRAECLRTGLPLLALGGEAVPDAELAALSTVPSAIVTQAFRYLTQGGVANLAQMLRFVVDTVALEGFGFDPPVEIPAFGVLGEGEHPWASGPGPAEAGSVEALDGDPRRPTVAVVFYRAHVLAGNVGFVRDLCDGIRAAGANALAVFGYSLRPDAGSADGSAEGARSPVVELLAAQGVDAVVCTMLAAGSLDTETDTWDAGALATLGVPVVQAMCATQSVETWESSTAGLTPMDVAMSVAIPEFDGRIVSVPFSFKEWVDADDVLGSPVSAYRTRPDRVQRVAGLATRLARLSSTPPADKRVAVVLSAIPPSAAGWATRWAWTPRPRSSTYSGP
jgi:cobaltochelatase CobN